MKFKEKMATVLVCMIASILAGSISAYAAASYLYNADEVSYDKTSSELTSTDVQGAIDELYNRATDYTNLQNKVGTATLTTTAQNLSEAVNELNTDRVYATVVNGTQVTLAANGSTNQDISYSNLGARNILSITPQVNGNPAWFHMNFMSVSTTKVTVGIHNSYNGSLTVTPSIRIVYQK